MNLLSISDGHMDILRGVVRREIQEWMATDDPNPKLLGSERNHDKAAHLLTIYDQLSDITAKWSGKIAQFGFLPLDDSGQEREIIEGTNMYLARDGMIKVRHLPD
ncbi:MAG: hypothetical protein KAX31_03455 [Thermoplasmata archaeon]|nr:hypothetical protein [Thermoplasmata archaeon]